MQYLYSDDTGHVWSTMREWKRRDWGDGGEEFSWWCTESPDAFVGDHTVLVSGRDELIGLSSLEIYELLLDAVAERLAAGPVLPHPAVKVSINGSIGQQYWDTTTRSTTLNPSYSQLSGTMTPSNVGITRWFGMRISFSDTVGTRLIISSATPLIQSALT